MLAMKNGPFNVALSELTTMMFTGLGSPALKVQLIMLVLFATLFKVSAFSRAICNWETHQNELGEGPMMEMVPVNEEMGSTFVLPRPKPTSS